MFAGRSNHLLDRNVIGNGGHLGAGFHDFFRRAPVQVDNLKDDFLLSFGEGALLKTEFE